MEPVSTQIFAVEIDRTEVRNTIPQIKQMLASCSQKLIEYNNKNNQAIKNLYYPHLFDIYKRLPKIK